MKCKPPWVGHTEKVSSDTGWTSRSSHTWSFLNFSVTWASSFLLFLLKPIGTGSLTLATKRILMNQPRSQVSCLPKHWNWERSVFLLFSPISYMGHWGDWSKVVDGVLWPPNIYLPGENPPHNFLWGLVRPVWGWELTRILTKGKEWTKGGWDKTSWGRKSRQNAPWCHPNWFIDSKEHWPSIGLWLSSPSLVLGLEPWAGSICNALCPVMGQHSTVAKSGLWVRVPGLKFLSSLSLAVWPWATHLTSLTCIMELMGGLH